MPKIAPRCTPAAVQSVIIGIFVSMPAPAFAQRANDAQGFPAKPIRIVVPFSPGGVADITPRIIGPKLVEVWRQPVVVDNRPGAGGVVGTEIVAKANSDGYTLLSASANHSATPAIRASLPFDTLRDFAGIALTSTGAYVLVVAPSFGAKSVNELIALAKAQPGQLNFSSAGTGSGTHFAAELFKVLANVDVVHVPYKGIPEALTDTVAGRVQFFMPSLSSVTTFIKDARLLALGVSTQTRVSGFPEIPTIAESGVPGYQWSAWTALLAPKKTPRSIVNQLHREVSRVLNLPEVQVRMAAIGAEVAPLSPEQLDKMIAAEVALTAQLARKAGIKAD